MSNTKPSAINQLRRKLLAVSGTGVGAAGLRNLLGPLTLPFVALDNAGAHQYERHFIRSTETSRIFKDHQHLTGFVYCQMIEQVFRFWELNNACIEEIIQQSGMRPKDVEDSRNRFRDSNEYNKSMIKELNDMLNQEIRNGAYDPIREDILVFQQNFVDPIDTQVEHLSTGMSA